ncbi:DUF294 nucleotidyltransferase-like domain-containing protein [Desulfuribacillus alkaliarsenatis]|uniref:Nucleotidyltransferase n=1 Tax=Desulfuribacillus alkaliarsenatis TaxID=766136 RepID=A0A1E5G031_9FIRM|nr:DUF294 nucleotidyltransferase-like domain-containing protein [Desulfuribacillus alkaliarsenatis]OEF96186.1 hypothetical protein BHF68_08435 [Desulfuribacillus alkaliarsenatis]
MEKKTIDILLQTAPFNKLPKNVVEALVENASFRTYQEQEFIFREKQELNEVYVVIEGMAMAVLTMSDGEESVIEFFRPGNFFGEVAAMAVSNPPISVQAVQPLTCLVFTRQAFSNLIHTNPIFAEEMTRIISERLLKIYRELHEEISHHKHGIETLPFRKKIGEFMSAPVLTCTPSAKVTEIAKIFLEHKISSIIVTKKNDNVPMGIVTESDLIKKVIAREKDIKTVTAVEIMGHPLHTIEANNYYYDALLKMVQNHIKHLAVVENNRLIGIVTVKDLMKARSVGTLSIVDSIEKQTTIEGLIKAQTEIDKVLEALVNEQAPAYEISTIITEFNDRVTRKIIQISEQQMIDEGFGAPPAEYCWLQLGASGRKEQLLRTPQNNAILYSDPSPNRMKTTEQYFATLAEKVVTSLKDCGFDECAKGITAKNPLWRKSFKDWLVTIDNWLKSTDANVVDTSTYLLDFRFVYGKKRIAEDLRYFILDETKPATMFLHQLTDKEIANEIPLGILGEIITPNSGDQKGMLNLRNDGYSHIVNCIRLYSLRYGAEKTSTFERIEEMVELGHFSKFEAKKYKEAFDCLLRFALEKNIQKVKQGKIADNCISPLSLEKDEQELLKDALVTTQKLQERTRSFLIENKI